MAQQTAVEWLLDRVEDVDNTPEIWNKIKVQAKEMEKEQIEAAWKRGDGEHDKVADKLAKQYYTKTYGK
jgi:transcriptional/translational regulatory protein YebC/TACO1